MAGCFGCWLIDWLIDYVCVCVRERGRETVCVCVYVCASCMCVCGYGYWLLMSGSEPFNSFISLSSVYEFHWFTLWPAVLGADWLMVCVCVCGGGGGMVTDYWCQGQNPSLPSTTSSPSHQFMNYTYSWHWVQSVQMVSSSSSRVSSKVQRRSSWQEAMPSSRWRRCRSTPRKARAAPTLMSPGPTVSDLHLQG